MGGERCGDDEGRRTRADAYPSAGIGAAAALTSVLPVLLVLEAAATTGPVATMSVRQHTTQAPATTAIVVRSVLDNIQLHEWERAAEPAGAVGQ